MMHLSLNLHQPMELKDNGVELILIGQNFTLFQILVIVTSIKVSAVDFHTFQ